jgi:hypothetical protein
MTILGVMAKWPRPGQVKTRLAAVTSPAWAAALAHACLEDTLERITDVVARRVVVFTPPDAQADFTGLVAGRFELCPQADGDLGQRMQAWFEACLSSGAERAVLLGSDSPSLPVDYIRSAFADLLQHDVVLGPATDGGYYLIGCARRVPPLFDGIAWSTSRVLAETVARIQGAGLALALLPPWYDVDTLDDCQVLRGHLAAMRRAGFDPGARRVEALLNQSDW